MAPSTTEDHPFWNATDREFQRADQLDAGDQLLTVHGQLVRVIGLRPGSQRVASAYNLTVDDIHTYYVLAGTKPILVHNAGPNCGIPVRGKSGDALGHEDFHGSNYSLDEIVGFANGHTGDANPAMGRPTQAQIETTLRQADPVQLAGQNSSRFDYNSVRVIVNWNTPWKSTAYYPEK